MQCYRLTVCVGSEREEDGEGLVDEWWINRPDRSVLFSARSSVTAQLDVQVQSDGRRGAEATCTARVSQRIAAWRRAAPVRYTVSRKKTCH